MKTVIALVMMAGVVWGQFVLEPCAVGDTSVSNNSHLTWTGDASMIRTKGVYTAAYTTNRYGGSIQLFTVTSAATYSLEAMREHGVTDIVRTLAEAGEVCKVYGHSWEMSWEWGKAVKMKQTRTCRICGKVQYKTEGWE